LFLAKKFQKVGASVAQPILAELLCAALLLTLHAQTELSGYNQVTILLSGTFVFKGSELG
jgi:hypothetical protein